MIFFPRPPLPSVFRGYCRHLQRSEMESSSSGLPKNPREADCSCRLQRSEMEFSSSGLLKNRRAADCCCRLQRSEMESSSLRIAEESSSSRLLLPSATS